MQDTASPTGTTTNHAKQGKGDNRANASNNKKAPVTKTGNNASGTQSAWPQLKGPTPSTAKVRPSACHPMPTLCLLGLHRESSFSYSSCRVSNRPPTLLPLCTSP